LVVSLTRLESKIDNINEKLCVFQDHVKESVPVRDDVRDCVKFKNCATAVLWAFFLALIGLIADSFGLRK
jgi:hypothetical protein